MERNGTPAYIVGRNPQPQLLAPPLVPFATGWRAYVSKDLSGFFVLQGGTNALGQDLKIDALTASGPTPLLEPPDAPAQAPMTEANASGGVVPGGNYYVQVTYLNAGGESLPSPTSAIPR